MSAEKSAEACKHRWDEGCDHIRQYCSDIKCEGPHCVKCGALKDHPGLFSPARWVRTWRPADDDE